jgi:hypothetical protein
MINYSKHYIKYLGHCSMMSLRSSNIECYLLGSEILPFASVEHRLVGVVPITSQSIICSCHGEIKKFNLYSEFSVFDASLLMLQSSTLGGKTGGKGVV